MLIALQERPEELVAREADVRDVVNDDLAVRRVDPPLDHHPGPSGGSPQHNGIVLPERVTLGVG